jgi:transposase
MPGFKKRDPLILSHDELEDLESISKNRTAPFARVKRASILLRYFRNESINSIVKNEHTSRPTVVRCIDKALSRGVMTALKDLPRPGRPRLISNDDKAWVIELAFTRPLNFGYKAERWTYALLASHVRKYCVDQGHPALRKSGKSLVHKILRDAGISLSKTKYFFEPQDEATASKMGRMLNLCRLKNQEICCFCGQPKQ